MSNVAPMTIDDLRRLREIQKNKSAWSPSEDDEAYQQRKAMMEEDYEQTEPDYV